jgi:hypothetical protein
VDANTLNAVIAVCGAVVAVATIVGNVFTYRKTQQVQDTVGSTHADVQRLANGSQQSTQQASPDPQSGAKKKW